MKGIHRVIVQNKRIHYDFVIRRNITVIQGDSATGKTTLIDMIREYYENGTASGVELICDKECAVLEGRTWAAQLSAIMDSIVFVDEGNLFVRETDFASAIQKTDNYYVIVTREGIPTLPYSVEEIYGVRNSGKYGFLKKTYNEFYHLYQVLDIRTSARPEKIIAEDSNSGFQFFHGICSGSDIACVSAKGKSNIFPLIIDNQDENILIIADGAAFGSEMEKIVQFMKDHPNVKLYLPESFEWMILKSGVIEGREIKRILTKPEDYIESREYFSWERFFAPMIPGLLRTLYLRSPSIGANRASLTPASFHHHIIYI